MEKTDQTERDDIEGEGGQVRVGNGSPQPDECVCVCACVYVCARVRACARVRVNDHKGCRLNGTAMFFQSR